MTEEPRLKRSLTVFPLVVIGLAYMDPLVVFDSYGIVAQLTKGHVDAAYIFTLLALLLTALSYGNMVKAFPKAGSAYTRARGGYSQGWAVRRCHDGNGDPVGCASSAGAAGCGDDG